MLANESFFTDLVWYDKECHGYPKGPNVSRVFGHVVLINYFKHKCDKNYILSATIKGKNDIKLAEDDFLQYVTERARNHKGLFKNHFLTTPTN